MNHSIPAAGRATRAATCAQAFLEHTLASATAVAGARLPTTAQLARQAGVSVNAMSTAVQALCGSGRLHARRKRGIIVGGEATMIAAATVPATSDGQLVDRIRHDIFSGRLSATTVLPTAKELAHRYGICRRTLHKAMAQLVSQRLIERAGRQYRIRRASYASFAGIACVVDSDFTDETPGFQYARRYAESVRGMEYGAYQRNATLHTVAYGPSPAHTIQRITDIPNLLGAVLCAAGRTPLDMQQTLALLNRRIVNVVVFDSMDETVPARFMRPGLRFDLLCMSQDAPARAMAHYLLFSGHARIAFLSPYHAMDWSLRRGNELAAIYAQAGYTQGVEQYTVTSATGIRPGAFPVPNDPTALLRPHAALNPVSNALCATRLHGKDRSHIRHALYHVTELRALRALMTPLFTQALARDNATAWVCVNDKIALLALEFLQRRGIAVPKHISIAGFDDSLEGLQANLTTYSFEISRGAARAVSLLLAPNLHRRQRECRIERFEGRIVARATVCRRAAPHESLIGDSQPVQLRQK